VIDLKSLTLREIRLTLKEPFVAAGGVQEHRRILLLEMRSRDGHTAWSECVAQERPGYSLETIDTAWTALRDDLAPVLLGAAADGQHVPAVLDAHVRGHPMATAALEMACWALEAERQNASLACLLGGTQARVPVGVALGMESDPSTLVEKVRRCVGEGYRKIKLKIAPGADRRFVAAVREAVGPDIPLAVDANGTYSRADLDVLRSLDAFGLIMLEQPLHRDDMAGHAALQRELVTPICLDESVTTSRDIEAMIRWGSGRIVNVKPGRVGGLARAMNMHDLCRESGLAAWVGGMLETGIGRAFNVALASLPNFSLPGDLSPSSRYWERDIVEPEWTMSTDGFVDVPFDRPGLGVEIDRDRIENLTRRADHIAS
jgi:O-succinylbenzoate synthase